MIASASATSIRPIHPFPARMAPALVLEELRSQRRLRILDPMAGSGTTIAVSKKCGHDAIGFDVDPLAVLLAQTWCSEVDAERVRIAADKVLLSARETARQLHARDCFPEGADKETRDFVTYWFDIASRRQLAALARSVRNRRDASVRAVLNCALSRIIIAKNASVSLAIDIPHSRPRRVRDKTEFLPFDRFMPAVNAIVAAMPFTGASAGRASIRVADARHLPLADETIDLVVTSPPYVNAIDYLRCSKFALVWLGHTIASLRRIRAESIGTEVGLYGSPAMETSDVLSAMVGTGRLPNRQTGILRRYVVDMSRIMQEISRVLVPGGGATFVIGDSSIRGVFVRNSEAIKALGARCGLRLESAVSRPLPDNLRYMPPPGSRRGKLDARMRNEVVIKLRKA
jgi:hypothetical protein